MLLPDHEIRALIKDRSISIDPFYDWMLQPASVEVTLGADLAWNPLVPHTRTIPIDPYNSDPSDWTRFTFDGDKPFILQPGKMILGTTVERIKLSPQIQSQLNGKSSLGRWALTIHATAGFIDPGFEGNVTLEIQNFNTRPMILRQGMPIGQLSFFWLRSPAERPYGHPDLGSHYQGQQGTTVPEGLRRRDR